MQEETERAARLFGAAEAALDAAGGAVYVYVPSRSIHEQAVAAVRSRLHEAVFSSAWAEGSAMPLGEAIEYALYGERPATSRQSPVVRAQEEAPVVLTRREQEVAALVGRGLTNRQIASELVRAHGRQPRRQNLAQTEAKVPVSDRYLDGATADTSIGTGNWHSSENCLLARARWAQRIKVDQF